MAEQTGEKTELPTQRRLEDAIKRGQTPRSAEVQTVFVLLGAVTALTFSGREAWSQLASAATKASSGSTARASDIGSGTTSGDDDAGTTTPPSKLQVCARL